MAQPNESNFKYAVRHMQHDPGTEQTYIKAATRTLAYEHGMPYDPSRQQVNQNDPQKGKNEK